MPPLFVVLRMDAEAKINVFLGMLAYWYFKKAPNILKRVEVGFPAVGQSFLPPDRVFAQIE